MREHLSDGLVSREDGAPAPDGRLAAGLSVVIPTLSRPEELARAVGSLLRQTRLPDEIVIVDQSPTDASRVAVGSVLAGRPDLAPILIYLLDASIPGLTHARNAGARAARFDIVVFVDDDVSVRTDCLARLEARLRADPRLVGVGAAIANYHPRAVHRILWTIFRQGPFRDARQELYWSLQRRTEDCLVHIDRLSGSCAAYRTEVVLRECFDEHYRGHSLGEDAEFSLRLSQRGLRLAIDTAARVDHRPSPLNRGDWGTRMAAEVCAAYYLLQRHFADRRDRWLSFGWLLAGLLLEAIARAVAERRARAVAGFFRGLAIVCGDLRDCSFIRLPARGSR